MDLRAVATARTVLLTWMDRSNAETQYIVERVLQKRDAFQVIARLGANATAYTDSSVPRGTHHYRVRAFSAETNQFSAYSNVASVRVK